MEDQLETNEMYAQLLGVTTQVGAQRRPEKQPAEQRPAVTETPRKHRLVLYVNGSVLKTPHGVQIIQLGEFISDCKKQVAAHYEKKEYRQVDYSHGVAELCYIVEQKVKALLERQDLHIELDSRTPEGSHLYNTLVDLSTSVFRGHV